jgi:pimeloyl-ACP methyl ester carboxylesterase
MKNKQRWLMLSIIVSICFFAGCVTNTAVPQDALIIQEQGSFAVGGTVITAPGLFNPQIPFSFEGQTLHGDHAYVFYQIPVNARHFPLVFLHGLGQFSKTWESTPDGREGFQNIFLRRGFATYLIDEPRRGRAGQSTLPIQINPMTADQMFFRAFRLGIWPNFFDGVQFPQDQESLNQFFRQIIPNTGPLDADVVSDAVAALFEKIGDGILVTHSMGGTNGWNIAMKSDNVRAIISYEPYTFVFPDADIPPPIPDPHPRGFDPRNIVPLQDFLKLTRMPIIIYYGDFIPNEPHNDPTMEEYRHSLLMARSFAEIINRHGGDATVIHLPEIGIRGNTHFPFSDLNNIEIADLLSKFLNEKGLDR